MSSSSLFVLFTLCVFLLTKLSLAQLPSSFNSQYINATLSSLPSLYAFWPLGNLYPAGKDYFNLVNGAAAGPSPTPIYATGRFSVSNAAVSPGGAGFYLSWIQPQLDFGTLKTSYTLAAWLKAGTGVQIIFDYIHPSNPAQNANFPVAFTVSQNPTNTLTFASQTTSNITMPCNMSVEWTFVAITYDAAANYSRLFCQNDFSQDISPGFVTTSAKLNLGYKWINNQYTSGTRFLCAAAFTSSLTIEQLLNLKAVCRYFEVTCTCLNGGTCIGANKCLCPAGYTNDDCSIAGLLDLSTISAELSTVSNLLAFYPLTQDYGVRDARATSPIDGVLSRPMAYLDGPFNVPSSSVRISRGVSDFYATFTSPSFNFASLGSSWTISFWFKTLENTSAPLFEFLHPSLPPVNSGLYGGFTVRFNPTNPSLTMNTTQPGDLSFDCGTFNTWNHAAFRYEADKKKFSFFCNGIGIYWDIAVPGPPLTSSTFEIGMNWRTGENGGTKAYSCLSVLNESPGLRKIIDLKEKCRLFSITCLETCLNGGTCIGYQLCKCPAGWTGLLCGTALDHANYTDLRLATLPSLEAFWPLSIDFAARNAHGTIHAYSFHPDLIYTAGPFGGSKTAIQFTSGTSNNYIIGYNEQLNIGGTSSFTFSAWVNMGPQTNNPIFSYFNGQTTRLEFWQTSSTNNLMFDNSDGKKVSMSCSMTNTWSFVAFTYDFGAKKIKIFCNTAFFGTTLTLTTNAKTAYLFLFGKRFSTPETATMAMACASFHDAALTAAQLLAVKDHCRNYAYQCSPSCQNGGTCTAANTCSCTADWTGPICNLPVCAPSCSYFGNCTYGLPNFCTCHADWTGSTCETALANHATHLATLKAALPTAWTFWPFNKAFGTNDASGNMIHASMLAGGPVLAIGPSGLADQAYETKSIANGHIWVNDTRVNIGSATSFTISSFGYLFTTENQSFWEYNSASNVLYRHNLYLRQHVLALSSYVALPSCNVTSTWHFLATIYDKASNLNRLACVDNTESSIVFTPTTSQWLLIGGRMKPSVANYRNRIACLSIYKSLLTNDQLTLVKLSCQLYYFVCSPNCQAGTCYSNSTTSSIFHCTACLTGWSGSTCETPICNPSCSYFGNCTLPNVCTCHPDWTGPTCAVATANHAFHLATLRSLLPPQWTFWPFNKAFGVNDASGNLIHALMVAGGPILTVGPDGLVDQAYETRNMANGHIWVNDSRIQLTATDFSIFSYSNAAPPQSWLWGYQIAGYEKGLFRLSAFNSTSLFIGTNNDSTNRAGSINSVENQWKFVAGTYLNASTMAYFVVDAVPPIPATSGPAHTSNWFTFGGRFFPTANAGYYVTRVACAGMYKVALSLPQMALTKLQCQLYPYVCPTNCAPGACYGNSTSSTNFSCTSCNAGWQGPQCDLAECVPPCNHGNCTAPNLCTCENGWSDATCSTATCTVPCQNSGSCNAPETCSCTTWWTGLDCTTPVCSPACPLGSVCLSSPSTCQCNADWTGASCNVAIGNFNSSLSLIRSLLPQQWFYWPLNSAFGSHDASGNFLHSTFEPGVLQAIGPFGSSATAYETSSSAGGYISANDVRLNMASTSWTITLFINSLVGAISPIFEFQLSGTFASQIWQYPDGNTLTFFPVINADFGLTPCSVQNQWKFIAATYNNVTNQCEMYCDTLLMSSGACGSVPITASWLLLGARLNPPSDIRVGVYNQRFACVSMYREALDPASIALAKLQCQLYPHVCPGNCALESCVGNLTSPSTFSCVACTAGWTGHDCTTPVCSPTCANGGTCDQPNVCICSAGWSGSDCGTAICASPCANGGSCTAPDTCTCTTQWMDALCLTPVCSPTCLNGGSCSAPNACDCPAGLWTGSICNTPLCIPGCLNGGACSAPNTCTCNSQWAGTLCSTPVCIDPCQSGGTCSAPDTCTCTSSWTGSLCDTPVCNPSCENGGSCDNPNICSCPSPDWSGSICTVPNCYAPSCSNGGTCIAVNNCSCDTGWTDPGCDTPVCSNSCFNGGSCTAPDTCTCTALWTGSICTQPICTIPCANGGTCFLPNSCTCLSGWAGSSCSEPVCSPSCLNGGTCSAPFTCSCTTGWTGSRCQTAICTNPCLNGGSCSAPETCTCQPGWTGLRCETPICIPSCSNGGSCSAPNTCACTFQWTGSICESPVCDPTCSNGGTCSAYNTCSCNSQWTGGLCQTPVCGSLCQNGGTCSAPETCSCALGWTGGSCQTPICFPSCNPSGGACTGPNQCLCNSGWTDLSCSTSICSPSCNPGGGSCSQPNNCTCYPGWTGPTCFTPICNPYCSNHGNCVGPNLCSCLSPWIGSLCDAVDVRTSLPELLQLNDQEIVDNLPPIERQVERLAHQIVGDILNDKGEAKNLMDSMSSLMDRLSNVSSMSPEMFADLATVLAKAADTIMMAATNSTEGEEQLFLGDGSMQCFVRADGSISSKVTKPNNSPGLTKDKLRSIFNSFMSMLVNMFGKLRQILRPGMDMKFAGQFYGATIFNMAFGDLPGRLLETNLANAKLQVVGTSKELFKEIPSSCPTLDDDSTVPVVLSAFIVNVMNIDQPFNMPTIAVRIYCTPKIELELNPDVPLVVTAKPSINKAKMFALTKVNSQCDVSKVKCNSRNADQIASLATFPVTRYAGDFVLIFPVIDLDYTALLMFDENPGPTSFTWQLNVTSSSHILSSNNSFDDPKSNYNTKYDLRLLISERIMTQFFNLTENPRGKGLTLYVEMKRDFSSYAGGGLPPSVCELQRAYGYHLRMKRVIHEAARFRRESDGSDGQGFELLPESNESNVVFESSYFGDFGSDLLVSPNTIEFAYIYDNFAELLQDNAAVFAFQVAAVVFFFIGLFFAYKYDKVDIGEWAFLPILSNKSTNKHRYLVTIHCSRVKRFELEPRIHLRLLGNIYDTPWRLMKDGIRENFKGKHPENFILTTFSPVGRIDGIELLVQSRKAPALDFSPFQIYVDRILVIDVQKAHKYVFLVKSTLKSGDPFHFTELACEDELKGYTYLISGHSKTGVTDVHPWLSILQRPLPSNWTRVERLACVVSALFMSMMISAMFYGRETASPSVGVKLGDFMTISWFTVWTSFIGAVIVIPPTAAIAFVFKKIDRQGPLLKKYLTSLNVKLPNSEPLPPGLLLQDELKTKQKKPFRLPYKCVILGWFLVSACVGTSAFICISYSLMWGRDKSLQWLTGMLLNVVQDIILIQPVKVVLMAIVNATLHSLPDDGNVGLGTLVFNKRTNRRSIELFKKLRATLVAIGHHIVYVLIFAIAIVTLTNRFSYVQIQVIRQYFNNLVEVAEPITGTIQDHGQILRWIDRDLLPNLLNGNQLEFGGRFRTHEQLYGRINPNVVLLGPLRLRQQRVSSKICPLMESMIESIRLRFVNLTYQYANCQQPYANLFSMGDSSEQRSFNESWANPMWFDFSKNVTTNIAPWLYRTTDGPGFAGWEASYSTGGYYVDLPRTLNEARSVVQRLIFNRWLDNSTSVFYVDFTLFNAQTNLFVPVKVIFEALSAGGLSYHVRMFPLQLYQYSGASSILVFIAQGLWVIVFFSHIYRLGKSMKISGNVKQFFKNDHWNILDLIQILLGLAIVGLFALRIYVVIEAVTNIKSMRSQYVNLDLLANWEDLMFNLYGILFFLMLMLFFRFLTFNKYWAIFTASLSKGKSALATYCFLFFACVVAFAALAFAVMGHQSWQFSSFARSCLNLTQGLIGIVDFNSVRMSSFYLLLVMLFSAVVLFLGGNMFVTIILASYSDVVVDVETETSWDHDLSDFIGMQMNLIGGKLAKVGDAKEKKSKKTCIEDLLNDIDDGQFSTRSADQCEQLEKLLNRVQLIVDRKAEMALDGTDPDDKMSRTVLALAREDLSQAKWRAFRQAQLEKRKGKPIIVPTIPIKEPTLTKVPNSNSSTGSVAFAEKAPANSAQEHHSIKVHAPEATSSKPKPIMVDQRPVKKAPPLVLPIVDVAQVKIRTKTEFVPAENEWVEEETVLMRRQVRSQYGDRQSLDSSRGSSASVKEEDSKRLGYTERRKSSAAETVSREPRIYEH